jgi:large subunit ribosomal protein L15
MNLSELIKIKKNRKTVGRGGARGGTSGKGHKGQKARSGGYVKAQFEGGQTPLTRRLPRRGFNNKNFSIRYDIISLEKIMHLVDQTNSMEVNKELLFDNDYIKKSNNRVKILLGRKDFVVSKPLVIVVDACSQSVKSQVESAGGKIILLSKTN